MFYIIFGLLLIPFHVGLWKLFEKAGRKGWESVIPFYDLYIWCKITNRPWWWVLLFLFPGINLIMFACLLLALAKAFGKYKTSEHLQAIFLFFYYFPKIAMEPETKYVPKEQRPKPKKSAVREWGEALIFAIVAATLIKGFFVELYKIPTSSMEQDLLVGDFLFVSKVNYGTRLPNTPLTFPFTHNSFYDLPGPFWPFKKSYVTWWEIPYIRMPGFQKIKRNDIVVFNFPANDTTINTLQLAAHNYYQVVDGEAARLMQTDAENRAPVRPWSYYQNAARQMILKNTPVVTHPVDKRSNYIKRCVGIPGDKLQVKDGILYINDEVSRRPENVQYSYMIYVNKMFSNKEIKDFQKKGITKEDRDPRNRGIGGLPSTMLNWTLTDAQYDALKSNPAVDSIRLQLDTDEGFDYQIFPNDTGYSWTKDNFGPIVVPKKGATVELTPKTLPLYKRIITAFEHHKLEVKGGQIYIDGAVATSYTFGQNYYFMMGDNRHGSADSRFWGFVPNDHVVGKASMIFMSTDDAGDSGFPNNIRWNRLFKIVH